MCLLFTKPAAVILNDEQLADMYKRNCDGFGVMYAEDGKLFIHKGIGKVEDWIAFHREHQHREAAWHLRMRTHGDIDLTNTHPYPVWGFEGDASHEGKVPMAMMHNGILAYGNDADKSKSDTWHYIRNFIRPLTLNDQSLAFTQEFGQIIGKHIDSTNKFVLMDAYGNVQVVNKKAGIEWNGLWLSNTYAWDARNEKIYPGVLDSHPRYNGYYSGYGRQYDFDDYEYGSNWSNRYDSSKSRGTVTKIHTDDSKRYENWKDRVYGPLKQPTVGKKKSTTSKTSKTGSKPGARSKVVDAQGKEVTLLPAPKAKPMLPNKTRGTRKPRFEGVAVKDYTDVPPLFKKDFEYIRAMLFSVSPWTNSYIPNKHVVDTISKFGVDVVDDVIAAYDQGYCKSHQVQDMFKNYEAMREFINRIYGLTV